MEFLYEYGLFLAKTATLVLAIGLVIGLVAGAAAAKNKAKKGQLQFTDLTKHYQSMAEEMQQHLLEKKQFKQWQKAQRAVKPDHRAKLFVLDFNGSLDARETESLREEVTAILAVAQKEDEVLLRLESGGGVVHGYGLAASQLDRLRQQGIKLTVAVDKVAASGGYMMACVANKIYAAPFAIVGSIGVVAQLPNFNRLLKKHEIDYEQHTAGDFKRTLTVFGENTDEGRQKFQQELEETHELFKAFVTKYRPQLDLAKVATGEHWYGQQAIELGLIDAISTSDDVLMQLAGERTVYKLRYQVRKKLADKIAHGASLSVNAIFNRLVEKNRPM
mgnify:CR=1 FL=1